MPVVELVVDRNLLCPNFDGYKLSFDAVPVLRQAIEQPLRRQPHSNQYSLLHVELFARHNLLFSDPWARHNCYFINKAHQVVLCSYDEPRGQPQEQRIIYSLERDDQGDAHQQIPGDYNYTLRFISEKYCVLCDGMLTCYLLDTGDRVRGASWQQVTRSAISADESLRGYVLYDARLDIVQERKQISLVAGHVLRRDAATENEIDTHVMQLNWSHWTQDDTAWTYNSCVQLEVKGSVYYCAFEPRAESLVVCSNGELQTRQQREAAQAEHSAAAATAALSRTRLHNGLGQVGVDDYNWTQTAEDVVVRFPLKDGASRNDFNILCTQNQLVVECLTQTLLNGALFAGVDNELTTWTVESEQLQLTLVKRQAQHWPRLLDAEHEAPAEGSATDSDQNVVEQLPIPNLEDPVEECDFPLGSMNDDIKMVRFSLSDLNITHSIYLGATPPLFATSLRAGYPAAFATRQGVDAAVWLQLHQPSREWNVRHEGTLHAFGYVQASKTQRKFVDCCPDLDYAVICETHRHVFIYKPRYDSAGGLRNRNGPQVVIGKQSLVTLDENVGEVLGLVTASNVITVLTAHAVLYLQV
ncbi:CG10347 [Drosophila busckii]|uniref:NudC domain-containing protein 1 n=1 Tax=Drosophila busckii TaxID=30019 RepID=A0A0M4FBF0_DROBS|nr:nudC domain-containing protein 1 [Drosophila busckii]ALC49932.1 CG10347 [Drosophila busckii]